MLVFPTYSKYHSTILCNSKARQVQPILIKQLIQESTLKTTLPWGSFTGAAFKFQCMHLLGKVLVQIFKKSIFHCRRLHQMQLVWIILDLTNIKVIICLSFLPTQSITVRLTSSLFCLDGLLLLTYVKWTTVLLVWSNPNQSNRRSTVQWYFPLWWIYFWFHYNNEFVKVWYFANQRVLKL